MFFFFFFFCVLLYFSELNILHEAPDISVHVGISGGWSVIHLLVFWSGARASAVQSGQWSKAVSSSACASVCVRARVCGERARTITHQHDRRGWGGGEVPCASCLYNPFTSRSSDRMEVLSSAASRASSNWNKTHINLRFYFHFDFFFPIDRSCFF